MVRERFDDAFERMRDQANRLAATERSAENFDEIVEQRVELDRLRDEVTNERKNIVSRFEPPATDVVTPPRGYVHTRLFGKIAAAVSVALLVVAGALIIRVIQEFDTNFPLEYVRVDESVDEGTCRWTVQVTLRNDSESALQIEHMETVLNRAMTSATPIDYPPIAPGETVVATAQWSLRSLDCPSTTDFSRGNLRIHLDNGMIVSRSFSR